MSTEPHYLYRHYDADDRLLYVGMTINPDRRPYETRNRPYLADSARVSISVPMPRGEAMAAERQAIADENPLHNVQRNNGNISALHREARRIEAAHRAHSPAERLAADHELADAIDRALRRAS